MRCVVSFIRNPQFVSGKWFMYKSLPARVVRQGFRCLIYLDDLLVLLNRNAFAKRRIALLRAILDCFGLAVNEAKSSFEPRTRFEHLGLTVDLR